MEKEKHDGRAALTRRSALKVAAATGAAATTVLWLAPPAAAAITWGHPLATRSRPTRPYGYGPYPEYSDGFHRGIDYGRDRGTAVYAAADGTVEYSGNRSSNTSWSWAGNHVIIRHEGGYRSMYAHLDSRSVTTGQSIRAHQRVGAVGGSGIPSVGNHLHFEIWTGSDRWATHTDPYPLTHNAPLPGEPLGEEMPTYISRSTSTPQTLSNGAMGGLRIEGTDVSIAIGGMVHAVVNFTISGLPVGESVQFRYVTVSDVDGNNKASLGAVEVIGTPGSTFGQISAAIDLGSSRRLRLEGQAFQSGVRVDSMTSRALRFA